MTIFLSGRDGLLVVDAVVFLKARDAVWMVVRAAWGLGRGRWKGEGPVRGETCCFFLGTPTTAGRCGMLQ